MLTVQSYSYAVARMYMHQRETNVTDCLELSLLSHLHQSLRIACDAGTVTAQHIYYDLNLLDSGSINGLELDIKYEISANTTKIWRNIHKTVLARN